MFFSVPAHAREDLGIDHVNRQLSAAELAQRSTLQARTFGKFRTMLSWTWGELLEAYPHHCKGLNIQGSTHKVYLSDPINGVVRSTRKGGDLISLNDPVHGPQTYLVTAVLEQWPDWTCAAATLQSP